MTSTFISKNTHPKDSSSPLPPSFSSFKTSNEKDDRISNTVYNNKNRTQLCFLSRLVDTDFDKIDNGVGKNETRIPDPQQKSTSRKEAKQLFQNNNQGFDGNIFNDCTDDNSENGMSFDSALQSVESSIIQSKDVGELDVLNLFSFKSPQEAKDCSLTSELKSSSSSSSSSYQRDTSFVPSIQMKNETIQNQYGIIEERRYSSASSTLPLLDGSTLSWSRSTSEETFSQQHVEPIRKSVSFSEYPRKQRRPKDTKHQYRCATKKRSLVSFDQNQESTSGGTEQVSNLLKKSYAKRSAILKTSSWKPSKKRAATTNTPRQRSLGRLSSITSLSSKILADDCSESISMSSTSSIDDFKQNHYRHNGQVRNIINKKRSMEIQYYRQKSIGSLQRSMIRYMKLNTVNSPPLSISEEEEKESHFYPHHHNKYKAFILQLITMGNSILLCAVIARISYYILLPWFE